MNFVKCHCGCSDFIRVICIVKSKPPIRVMDTKLICTKCKKEYTSKQVNEVLGKVE